MTGLGFPPEISLPRDLTQHTRYQSIEDLKNRIEQHLYYTFTAASSVDGTFKNPMTSNVCLPNSTAPPRLQLTLGGKLE
jgi:hypothetical protein